MKPEITKQLETIIDKREQQNQAAAARASERQKAEARNLADFAIKIKNVILPAFQEIVELYGRRGLQIRIVEEQERPNDRGGISSPSVRLDMSALYHSTSMQPEFRLSLDKHNGQIFLHIATSSSSGPGGNVALEKLTADWIQGEFVKYQASS